MNHESNHPESPKSPAEVLRQTDLFDVKTVGPNTISAISIMGEHEKFAGNVLRRLCKLGGEACAQTCALHQEIIEKTQENIDQKCADENLQQVIYKLGTDPENVFMVGVTADNIGFADEVDKASDKYPYKVNPVTDVKELTGFNAFFARKGDTIGDEEIVVLGRRCILFINLRASSKWKNLCQAGRIWLMRMVSLS
jgi:hypothetical protein